MFIDAECNGEICYLNTDQIVAVFPAQGDYYIAKTVGNNGLLPSEYRLKIPQFIRLLEQQNINTDGSWK